MEKQVEASNLDTSVEFAALLKEKGVHKQVLTNLKKKEIVHPTIIQKTLFDMFGKKQNFVIDAPGNSGKTSGCLLFTLCSVLQKKTSMSIAVIVPNHKFIANVFTRLLEIVQHTPVRLINLDSEKEIEKGVEAETVNVYIGSYNSFFKCFQEQKIPVEEFSSFIFDDVEYSISLGNTPKLLQLCKFLQNKIPEEQRSFFLVSGNTELDNFKELKESFGVKFTNLKLVSEPEEPADKETEEMEDQQRVDIMRTMIKQFYYIGAENHLYCALYVVSKFDVMKGSILLVAEDVDMAYRLKVFLDRAHSGESQVYNTEGVINIRAYNVALFNGGSVRYLIVPKEFLKDYKKNKNTIQRLKNVRNLIFFNCELSYDEYNGFLNQFKGALNLNSTKNLEIGYKVLYLAMNSVDEELKPKDSLLNLMSHQKNKFGQVLYEPLAVPRPDIEGFSYSVGAVLDTITKKTVKVFKLIELKRNILKNVNMKKYFETHETEKNALIKSLNELREQFENNINELPKSVPFYLLPSFLRKKQDTELEVDGPVKVPLSLKKRGPKGKAVDQYVMIDSSREDPQFMDPSQLISFSNRKLWKRRHGLSFKKKRLTKKDIMKGKHI